jgi:hypothetical protein
VNQLGTFAARAAAEIVTFDDSYFEATSSRAEGDTCTNGTTTNDKYVMLPNLRP